MEEHFKVYSILLFSSFITGWYLNSYGVLIPFYSQDSGLDQTHYSFIFIVRSVAYTTGSFATKYLAHIYSAQHIYLVSSIVFSLAMVLCSISISTVNLTVMLFVSGFCLIAINVLSFTIVVALFKGNRPQFWLLFLAVTFSIGAALSPLLTIWLQLSTYTALGFFSAITIPLLLRYNLPCIQESHQTAKDRRLLLSRKSQFLICMILMIFPIQEIGFASWLPTYSIKAGIATVQQSAIYSMYFWISNTVSRAVWIFLVTCSITKRVQIITISTTIMAVGLLFLQQMELYLLVCILGPLVFGFMLGCMHTFCFALPVDSGFHVTNANNAHFMFVNCIGEGLLLAPVGYLMKAAGFQTLPVVILVSCCLSYWCFREAVVSMDDDKQRNKEEGTMMEPIAG